MTWSVISKPEATRQALDIDAWWRSNRRSAASLFQDELARALDLLENTPEAGIPIQSTRFPTLRRMLLRRSGIHVYFVIDEDACEVVVLAFWGARRGVQPDLG